MRCFLFRLHLLFAFVFFSASLDVYQIKILYLFIFLLPWLRSLCFYLPFTPKGYFLIWSPIIDYCHSLFRLESTKGSYAKEWSKWEKKLREVLIGNAEYLNSIQVILFFYNLIYSAQFNANGFFWKQLEQKIIFINR